MPSMIFIKGWPKFQHFKDRNPIWIKLYRNLLDDINWHELDAESAKTLISLWLLASEDKNNKGGLPSIKEIAFRLRVTEKSLKSSISKLGNWLLQGDIKPISDIKTISPQEQLDALEKERETEREKEKEKEIEGALRSTRFTDESLSKDWEDFCVEERPDLNPQKTFEKFKDYWIALPGQKGSKLNWTATWRNWVRNQNGVAQTKGNSLAERNQAVAALWLAEQDAKEKGVEREIN